MRMIGDRILDKSTDLLLVLLSLVSGQWLWLVSGAWRDKAMMMVWQATGHLITTNCEGDHP